MKLYLFYQRMGFDNKVAKMSGLDSSIATNVDSRLTMETMISRLRRSEFNVYNLNIIIKAPS